MEFSFINVITLIAYLALAADMVIQVSRVWRRQHGDDISAIGTAIRTIAAAIILVKLSFVGDPILLLGQVVMVVLLGAYLLLVFRYRTRL